MASAAAKPGYSWQQFNEWARDVMERTKKHPGVRTIREWWHANAQRVWPCPDTRPSIELAERHAKGLRSKESIRNYFRKYRARRKQSIVGRNSDKALSRKVEFVAHASDSEVEDDEDVEADVNRQVLGNVDEQHQVKCGDEYQREAAETLVMTLNSRPQRTRFAPSRFRSDSPSVSGRRDDSCGSASLGDNMEDSEESGADISPEGGVASNDNSRDRRSKNERSRRKPRRSAARIARGGTSTAPDSLRPSKDSVLHFGTCPQESEAPHQPPLEVSAGTLSEIYAHVGLLQGHCYPWALLGPTMLPGGICLPEHDALHLASLQAPIALGAAPAALSHDGLSAGPSFPCAMPGCSVGTHGIRAHEHEEVYQAFLRALAVPGKAPEVDAHEGLLHLLASAGEHALPPSFGAPPLGSVFLEAMGLPHQAVFPRTWCAGNRDIQEVAGASIYGQSTYQGIRKTPTPGEANTPSAGHVTSWGTPPGAAATGAGIVGQSAFLQNANIWNTPTPGSANPQSAGRAIGRWTPGVAAAAQGGGSHYCQLRRMLSAPLITTQALNVFGYDFALNANLLTEYAVQTGAEKGHVTNHVNSTRRPAVEQTTDCISGEESFQGRMLTTRKRAISDGGHRFRRQKARVGGVDVNKTAQGVEGVEVAPAPFGNSDQLRQHVDSCTPVRKASDSTIVRSEQARATSAFGLVTDAVTPLQSHRKQHDAKSSSDDLLDLANADLSTVIRLGRMLASDFGVSLYPELGLGALPQNSEGTDGHLGWPDQVGTSATAADGAKSSGTETSTDETKVQGCLVDAGGHQAGLRPSVCESGLAYLKQEPETSGTWQPWVPVGSASSMYGGVYESGAASPTVNTIAGLLYPSGVSRHGMRQLPLLYMPPPL
ncbi:hypothetical protein VaNZ11_015382 [Volvox africanus]|uniref:Uncharacterized protein n=1 Tax=Volvox africanus TaxID=51714 RepID=A0ABQ5SKF8_9CHLO|nr:hypothetical protein VaNZ11_015382 [Volvox africanus]